VLIGSIAWKLHLRALSIEPVSVEKMAFALPDKPSMGLYYFDGILRWSGRDEEARAEAAEVCRINPNFSLERFAKRPSPKLTEALRRAGLK
jgi:hypothetical protein